MTTYLISFPAAAMVIPEGELDTVVEESHAVIREMKEAGVYVFGGGLDTGVPVVRVTADGIVTPGAYSQTAEFDGGLTVIRVGSRAEAERWAAKVAASCRCAQELREFGDDPES
ncbi:YciI family protein [Microbacterium sp. 179-B 1A2 NHS]|uniref:YciI family protein n=1 Tax=Microbacterium sp. 179-B 1A2 NHS TaxID=3142383 RepID=UPI0039A1D39D